MIGNEGKGRLGDVQCLWLMWWLSVAVRRCDGRGQRWEVREVGEFWTRHETWRVQVRFEQRDSKLMQTRGNGANEHRHRQGKVT
jgi:hypothetical protein